MSAYTEMQERLDKMTELEAFGEFGYDWSEFRSWYDQDARIFYWGSASGCSCYEFWDYFESLADFGVGRKEELLAAAAEWKSDPYTSLEEADYNRFTAQVRAIKTIAGPLKVTA
jgi:hypothetical protein